LHIVEALAETSQVIPLVMLKSIIDSDAEGVYSRLGDITQRGITDITRHRVGGNGLHHISHLLRIGARIKIFRELAIAGVPATTRNCDKEGCDTPNDPFKSHKIVDIIKIATKVLKISQMLLSYQKKELTLHRQTENDTKNIS
jgi:hypothetical protein